MNTKSNSIEALRFIFMLIICIWHFDNVDGIPNGYMGVEFFFVVSGFLLYYSAKKRNVVSTFDYTFAKIRRFAPEYIFVVVFIYLRHMIIPAICGVKVFSLE